MQSSESLKFSQNSHQILVKFLNAHFGAKSTSFLMILSGALTDPRSAKTLSFRQNTLINNRSQNKRNMILIQNP
jgi:hypothetical protein